MDLKAEPEITEKPVKTQDLNAQDLTYEQCIAYSIVGKLVLDGAIDPRNFNFDTMPVNGLPFIVNSIADSIRAGLEAYGWQDTLGKLIDWGSVKPSEKDGAE